MSVTPKTYLNILTKGLQSSLATTPIEDGKLRYTTDTGRLYMDNGNNRIEISDLIESYTEAQILALQNPLVHKIYIASDTGRPYIRLSNSWYFLGNLKLTLSTDDADKVIWFSDTTDKEPEYSNDLVYNPDEETLKVPKLNASSEVRVGDMIITDTEDAITGYHTVNFAFAAS